MDNLLLHLFFGCNSGSPVESFCNRCESKQTTSTGLCKEASYKLSRDTFQACREWEFDTQKIDFRQLSQTERETKCLTLQRFMLHAIRTWASNATHGKRLHLCGSTSEKRESVRNTLISLSLLAGPHPLFSIISRPYPAALSAALKGPVWVLVCERKKRHVDNLYTENQSRQRPSAGFNLKASPYNGV